MGPKLATASTSQPTSYPPKSSADKLVILAAVAVAIASICAAAVPAMMGAPSAYRQHFLVAEAALAFGAQGAHGEFREVGEFCGEDAAPARASS